MPQAKGIYWLASYPKSGNTWFRIVLARLLNPSSSLHYINDMDTILGSPMVANRSWMNKALGFDSGGLSDDEVDKLRPNTYKSYAEKLQHSTYIKIHDAYTYLEDNTPVFPPQGCLGAIYFIRNPLDVAISLAHHVKCPIDWSIHMMGNHDFAVPLAGQRDKQLRQKLLSWSKHVQSWANLPAFKVLVLRYEDMFYYPEATFSKALQFLNLDFSASDLAQALSDTAFAKLQQHEKDFGFRETPGKDGQFFRKGMVGDWKNTLTAAQIDKIMQDHSAVMAAYEY